MSSIAIGLTVLGSTVLGYSVGVRLKSAKVLGWIARVAFAGCCGLAITYAAWRGGWTWPIGLITPLLYGLAVSVLVACLVDKWVKLELSPMGRFGARRQHLDGLAGAVLALVVSGVLARGVSRTEWEPSRESKSDVTIVRVTAAPRTALGEFAKIAHEGFIQHVPVAGHVADELMAVARILDQPIETRRQFAIAKQWDSLAELPSFHAIAEDEVLVADIDAAAEGSLLALFRLQKHPLVLEFAREEKLQSIVSKFDARQIAEELDDFSSQLQ